MSVKVLNEVFDHSRSTGHDFCVLIALADAASHDGVTWLPIEAEPPRRSITSRAHCSRETAIRAVRELRDELAELQTVKVRRGRSTITVYRVVVGAIAETPVDYDRLPFELPHPFGVHGVIQTLSTGAVAAMRGHQSADRQPELESVNEAPSNGAFTVAGGDGSQCQDSTVHGGSGEPFTVSASRARVKEPEPSEEPAAEPSRETDPSGTEPAAAVEGPPSQAIVKRVVGALRMRDSGTVKAVEQLAGQLPVSAFLEIAGRVDRRRASGSVDNDAGLLITLLRLEVGERREAEHQAFMATVAAAPRRESFTEVVKRDYPEAYVRALATRLTDDELAEQMGDTFDHGLRELARGVRSGDERGGLPCETSSAARARWIDEYSAELPIEDIRQVVADWNDVDDIERSVLLKRAEAAQAASAPAARGVEAA